MKRPVVNQTSRVWFRDSTEAEGEKNSLILVPPEHRQQQTRKQSLKEMPASSRVIRKGRRCSSRKGEGRGPCCPLFIAPATIPHWSLERNGSEKSRTVLTTAP